MLLASLLQLGSVLIHLMLLEGLMKLSNWFRSRITVNKICLQWKILFSIFNICQDLVTFTETQEKSLTSFRILLGFYNLSLECEKTETLMTFVPIIRKHTERNSLLHKCKLLAVLSSVMQSFLLSFDSNWRLEFRFVEPKFNDSTWIVPWCLTNLWYKFIWESWNIERLNVSTAIDDINSEWTEGNLEVTIKFSECLIENKSNGY